MNNKRQRIINKLNEIPAGTTFTARDVLGMFPPTSCAPNLQLIITAIREYPRARIERPRTSSERRPVLYRMAEA